MISRPVVYVSTIKDLIVGGVSAGLFYFLTFFFVILFYPENRFILNYYVFQSSACYGSVGSERLHVKALVRSTLASGCLGNAALHVGLVFA